MDHGREQGRHTYEVRPKVERVWGETKPWDIKRLYNFLGFNFRFEWMLSIRLPLVEVFQYNYSVLRQYFNCRIRTGREELRDSAGQEILLRLSAKCQWFYHCCVTLTFRVNLDW